MSVYYESKEELPQTYAYYESTETTKKKKKRKELILQLALPE